MSDGDVVQLAKALNKAGIQLQATYEPIGCEFYLKPNDVTAFLADRDAFFAAECGLSKDDYLDWKRFVSGGCRCVARKKDGSACTRKAKTDDPPSPQDYVALRDSNRLLCGYHSRKK